MTQRSLTGRVALITGAAQRIGAYLAQALHREGMDLVLHYRHSAAAADALRRNLERDRPGSVGLLQADLHDHQRYAELADEIGGFCGRLDLLVNNASSFYPTLFGTITEAQWEDLLGTNLKAPFFLAQQLAPLLRRTNGSVINLVDIHARRPLKRHPVYSIAKAGNAMMVKSLARELGPEIRVNGVAPGVILWPEAPLGDEVKDNIVARTALKRPGTPEDVARTVLFLFRDAPYVTGQIITVDGGRTLQQ